jgi:hypothetical protein
MRASHFSPDIQEFLRLLAVHGVRYVIVGGEAVIYHGHARLTGDVDIFFEPEEANARSLFSALTEFWNGKVPGVASHEDLLATGTIIQFGAPPNRLDLLGSITGVPFGEAWDSRVEEHIELEDGTHPVHIIGKEALVRNKERIGRSKDLDDLEYLK